jgi:two-component system KDP operon response regulator KdpE
MEPALAGLAGYGFTLAETDYAGCAEALGAAKADVVLLDLGDTESQGLKLCAQLRAESDVPIVALGVDERWFVPALSVGADEYLGRPLDLPKTLAVLMALLRRCGAAAKSSRLIQVRSLAIDLDRCRVMVKNKPVHLTPVEYRLLAAMARREGRVASCSELVKEVQGYDMDEEEARDIMKVHVYHLRHKLRSYGAEEDFIVTVPGFGYVLERRASTRAGAPASGWLRRGTYIQRSGEEAAV